MKLVLNSMSCHSCPVELREKIIFGDHQQRRIWLERIHCQSDVGEAAIIETCNRLEFYTYTQNQFDCNHYLGGLVAEINPDAGRIWSRYSTEKTGIEVVEHLFELTAGLNSQMLGENQIFSQVKAAYAESVQCGASKTIFHKLFHTAFRVGKAVRCDTDIICGAVSISLEPRASQSCWKVVESGKAGALCFILLSPYAVFIHLIGLYL